MKLLHDRLPELSKDALRLQREYYSRTAAQYEDPRRRGGDEFALSFDRMSAAGKRGDQSRRSGARLDHTRRVLLAGRFGVIVRTHVKAPQQCR